MINRHTHLRKLGKNVLAGMFASLSTLISFSAVNAATLRVKVENIAPQQGNFFSSLWVGFHDGNFDFFDVDQPPNLALERLAEDADLSEISSLFNSSSTGSVDGIVFGPTGPVRDFFPGDSASATFTVDGSLANSRYFSYGAMILPSNDAFVGNDNPLAYRIFDDAGKFIPTSFVVLGADVLDAGSEINDESRFNAAGAGPTPFDDFQPNTGIDENGVVTVHPGFIPGGNILGDPNFANANFRVPGYQVARITITQVPEPNTFIGLLFVGSLFFLHRQKGQKARSSAKM
ncbi:MULTISPECIES: spondin domain-containing protein [unclassified Anabaena]|uniref:spondin domain-containing protein n=1 Tax=unclassified Anabaena TaxID=2619674 RepID=UPI0039C7527D